MSRIDPRTRKVVDEIGVGTDVHDLAAGFGSVWVADGTNGTVTRIDPKTGVVETLPLGAHRPVFWVATGAGSVWATSGDVLLRIDPQTDRVVSRTEFFAQPTGLAAGSAIWVTTDDQKMLRYSPRHLSSSSGNFDLRAPGLAPTVGDGSVWVIVYSGRGVIQPVDAESLSLGPGTETSAIPLDVTVEKPAVWAVGVDGNVLRIDPDTAAVVATIPTAPTLRSAIAVGAGAVWVAMQGT